jgi:multidrug efflux system outer membrane protein
MRTALIALTALSLSACGTLAPHYERPAAPVPATWPQGQAYPAASGPETAAPPDWRATFTDARLQGLIQTALGENRSLRAAVADVAAARAQYDVQRSSLLPTVSATGQATYARAPVPDATGKLVGQESHGFTAGVGVSAYELDLFGRQRSLSNAAFEQYLATDEGRRAAQLAVISEVANDYIALAADRALLQIAVQTQGAGQESLDLTQHRFQEGVSSELDVRQAQTIVEQARADVARYTAAAARDKNALELAVGAPVDDASTVQTMEEVFAGLAEVPAGLKSDILLLRPDVLQAEHQLRAANANIGAARAAFFPSITLTGGVGQASSSLGGLFSNGVSTWSFIPAISLPIFDAGRNSANLRLTKAQRDAAVAQYEGAIQTAFREVADALADRAGTERQLEAERALVEASAGALRLATARYQRGTDPYLTTLESQRQLYVVEQGLVLVELARAQNTVALYRSLGGQ